MTFKQNKICKLKKIEVKLLSELGRSVKYKKVDDLCCWRKYRLYHFLFPILYSSEEAALDINKNI